ncbi:WD repeat protein [Tolypocladium capitatum]|uniref:WD repeat protein n=1 Tax=Tolypocladium capitatum TaxID=45235 RepID=A0A2K3QDJ0_9HYPO|nr:WD repeat protein [Tolypocladium capitatum]
MAKKARQRISYVLENAKSSAGGHRLGVNGLAADASNGILYSGGRDGIVCAWDVNFDQRRGADASDDAASERQRQPATKFRAQTQAHMHWINDITLAQNNTALVSASSDLTVKVWRLHSEEDNTRAQSIGEHADYVKCVATPPAAVNANWVASGGLDRKICLWDLNGAGKTLEFDVKGEEVTEKGSVYALAVGRNILASGGPEKTVRLYDPRTGSRISKLVGHLDNIRSILIDEAGDTILSASADKTIKMWSVKGGRCMYTFTMHDESIWSLYSNDPRLGIFYSSDRSGLVAKTDVRGSLEDVDDGLSLAVAQEHFGVSKVVAAAGNIWTATNRSSINRWADVNTSGDIKLPGAFRHQRAASAASNRLHQLSLPNVGAPNNNKEIAAESILRISNTAVFPARSALDPDTNTLNETLARRGSQVVVEQPDPEVKPIHQLPEETIEGQFGLLKHKMLNDRRRVLTLDTAGDVLMWDLIMCKPIRSFGKQHLEDVEKLVNTREAVAPWCSVDLSSGNLTVVLEPFNCFDAELYADGLKLEEPIEFREDQRSTATLTQVPQHCYKLTNLPCTVSLGRWILRYLFSNLIDEEIKRDESYRRRLNEEVEKRHGTRRATAPSSIDIPQPNTPGWEGADQVTTPRANGSQISTPTPGLGIGIAVPGSGVSLPGVPEDAVASPSERGHSGDRDDYLAVDRTIKAPVTPATETPETKVSTDNNDKGKDKDKDRDKDKDKDKAGDSGKSPGTPFGKKFRMSFGSKKLGRSSSQAIQEKLAVVEDKAEESESSSNHEKEVDDSFFGVVQKIRNEYDKQLAETPDKPVETKVTPSLPTETPVLKLPPGTRVIIQEETSGGSSNIYQGTVEEVGRDADLIEQKAPMWLGELLLQNRIPLKEPVKTSFVLNPMDDLPPISPADGTNRLNANRMLRVKKILAYVSERIEELSEEDNPDDMAPEEYLELYCNDQLLDTTMSLATIRTHVWKGGNDVVLYYKANGRKEIKPLQQPSAQPAEGDGAAAQAPAPTAAPEASNATQAS